MKSHVLIFATPSFENSQTTCRLRVTPCQIFQTMIPEAAQYLRLYKGNTTNCWDMRLSHRKSYCRRVFTKPNRWECRSRPMNRRVWVTPNLRQLRQVLALRKTLMQRIMMYQSWLARTWNYCQVLQHQGSRFKAKGPLHETLCCAAVSEYSALSKSLGGTL